jgi:hypothetical protein
VTKEGNSNLAEQTNALLKVLSHLKCYHTIVLGEREFCSVDLASWLRDSLQEDGWSMSNIFYRVEIWLHPRQIEV